MKKIHLAKKSLRFNKWNFLAQILKNLLYFPIFWETETPSKFTYFSGKGNFKKLLIFRKMELLSPSSKNKKNWLRENFLHSGKTKLSNSNIKKTIIFSQNKGFPIFPEIEVHPPPPPVPKKKKIAYILENKTFLYVQKRKFPSSKNKKKHS